ncbi:Bgt-5092 [Blumeria graminis f. sp. tritici]|uniref:Bgt-5092 n=2 Tax=Blumeria graminis f. sp. tritici TaxID=62690 RepID=A0A381L5R1_BLUGR|nr:Nucleolar protein component of the small subunit (SSU) processome [Blumeria graminis f. sp. tritici 96224]VDB90431.1 Bgt-5092 [Blumeria graminis f. sp. tritici]
MPGRQSHGAPKVKKVKSRSTSKRKSLNALSIATRQDSNKTKIKSLHSGAEVSGNKRRRQDLGPEDIDELDDTSTKKPKKDAISSKLDDFDSDKGSDSEGNEWITGNVGTDDDSELDSDEAFGESDEDRFEGFTFSGSSRNKPKKKAQAKDINLDESEDELSDSELEEGDLGEDAVDLAAVLDMSDSEDEAIKAPKSEKNGGSVAADDMKESDDSEEDYESEESEASSSTSSEEDDSDDEAADPQKLADLQNLIAELSKDDKASSLSKQKAQNSVEHLAPSTFGLTSKVKLTLNDLGISAVRDSNIKKSLKFLKPDGEKITGKLDVPLAKRQQDRLDRTAAYEKSKETLDRWTETVKLNRRAEHLSFPLVDNGIASTKTNHELAPIDSKKPFNDLEATIQTILEESGLAAVNGKDEEDSDQIGNELETNNMSLEEVKAKRIQLRMARELLFREEAKSKRIKKIKSKSYRRVHRRQREKAMNLEQQALEEEGLIPSEDEMIAQDRRRAEERMGAKHRGSKWAKSVKATGRAAWDEDARSGIVEMARRDEELRKRVEGKRIRVTSEKSDASDASDDESNDESDEQSSKLRNLQKLKELGKSDLVDSSMPGARLANMDFMRRADAARKKRNDATVEEMRRELAGEEASSEEEPEDIGRRVFGLTSAPKASTKRAASDGESVESGASEAEWEPEPKESVAVPKKKAQPQPRLKSILVKNNVDLPTEGGAWSKVVVDESLPVSTSRKLRKTANSVQADELDLSQAVVMSKKVNPSKPSPATGDLSDESDDDQGNLGFLANDQELIKRAFAGSNVVGEFEVEKKRAQRDEAVKTIDNTLPGWGNWVGDGVSKREQKRNKGRFLTETDGVRVQKRKDVHLQRVIISEKKVKKNGKYLATSLPHPFETRLQYERSLRLPIGQEWTTKETFQDATKPRILLKQGIIAPMSKPLL